MGTLIKRIQDLHPVGRKTKIIAIDGWGGSGKSDLANTLADHLAGVTIVRTDDFARPNVSGWEWRRMKEQVLDPIQRDEPGRYQRYDWGKDQLAEWHDVPVGGYLIIEGVSSMRKELGRYWDLSIWIECPYELCLQRGIERDGEAMRTQWVNVWMPEEQKYVKEQQPDQRADLVLDGSKPFSL